MDIIMVFATTIPPTSIARMPMTAVPQRTALSHAFGALAAALVGTAEFERHHSFTGYQLVMANARLTWAGALGFHPAQLLPAGRVVRVAEKGFTSIFQADFTQQRRIARVGAHRV
jgi:hypothetical protein